MNKPVAITMGDPAGIGPELINKLADYFPDDQFLVFGDVSLFEQRKDLSVLSSADQSLKTHFNVVNIPCHNMVQFGRPDLSNAEAVVLSIQQAVRSVKSGIASALLTSPINKAVLREGANFEYPGHTEFLAALDGNSKPVMLLHSDGILSVVPATIHIPLANVAGSLNEEELRQTIEITAKDLEKFLKRKPRIWVAGLNPHAGENGHIGQQEQDWIAPLVVALQKQGYDIWGPFPADTMFHRSARENYDVAICMYHDQALIPIKTLAFDKGVNVTLGLSFVRTSPDHGTAFDIAGKNIAKPDSMIEAYKLAKAWGR